MKKIIEIVPNYSEGLNRNIMNQIISPFENNPGINLVRLEMEGSYNRSVVTIIGEANTVIEKMVESAVIASELIDLRHHKGEHPRMGAVDVIPLIPIKNINEEECIELSKVLAKKINQETGVPIFLYAKSATQDNRVNLPDIREGEFEGLTKKMINPLWHPDFGKPQPHPSAGATAVGCRKPLVAFNIDVDCNEKKKVQQIARKIRFSGGGYRYIQANAAHLHDRNIYQVTMNLTDYTQTALYQAIEATIMEGKRYKIEVTSTEIVGLVNKECLVNSLKYYLCMDDKEELKISLEEIVFLSIKYFKLRDFTIDKIIEYYLN